MPPPNKKKTSLKTHTQPIATNAEKWKNKQRTHTNKNNEQAQKLQHTTNDKTQGNKHKNRSPETNETNH